MAAGAVIAIILWGLVLADVLYGLWHHPVRPWLRGIRERHAERIADHAADRDAHLNIALHTDLRSRSILDQLEALYALAPARDRDPRAERLSLVAALFDAERNGVQL